jgi:hypothetical protein
VRERIKRQKAQIRVLEHEDRSTRRATALLRQLEMTLHLMNGHRAVILQKARAGRCAPRAWRPSRGPPQRPAELAPKTIRFRTISQKN